MIGTSVCKTLAVTLTVLLINSRPLIKDDTSHLPQHILQTRQYKVFHHAAYETTLKKYMTHHSSIYKLLLSFKTSCQDG